MDSGCCRSKQINPNSSKPCPTSSATMIWHLHLPSCLWTLGHRQNNCTKFLHLLTSSSEQHCRPFFILFFFTINSPIFTQNGNYACPENPTQLCFAEEDCNGLLKEQRSEEHLIQDIFIQDKIRKMQSLPQLLTVYFDL